MQFLYLDAALLILQLVPCRICLGNPIPERDVELEANCVVREISVENLRNGRTLPPKKVRRWCRRRNPASGDQILIERTRATIVLHGRYEVQFREQCVTRSFENLLRVLFLFFC